MRRKTVRVHGSWLRDMRGHDFATIVKVARAANRKGLTRKAKVSTSMLIDAKGSKP